MPTTLAQEAQRSTATPFREAVKAALMRKIPDVIGEAVGGAITAPIRDKRHAWAMSVLRDPDYWTDRAASLICGEMQVRNVEVATSLVPADNVITGRLDALINDMAGVLAGE